MNERMKLSEFLLQNPDAYWALIYSAWGGVYAAITVSTLVVLGLTERWKKEYPGARCRLFTFQLIWSTPHLLAVFGVPWLIGTISAEVIRESKYFPLMLLVWFLGVLGVYLLVRPFKKLWEIGQ